MNSTKVYLIGVNHLIQHTTHMTKIKKTSVQKFTAYIHEQVTALQITTIAEEFSEEALRGAESIARQLAKQLNIEHRFCDPNTEERNKLKIDSIPKREQVWLERIQDLKNSKILFICGSLHLNTFKNLLENSDIKTDILSNGWGSELDSDEHYGGNA